MNRFMGGNRFVRIARKIHLTFIVFAVTIVLVLLGLSSIAGKADKSRKESLELALQKDIMHCYAIEGTYPPSLDYIAEHYGLVYDEDAFFVDYQANGANLMPDVTIIELK